MLIQVITKLHNLMPMEILMPDTSSVKGQGTKLYSLITDSFPVSYLFCFFLPLSRQ